MSQWEVTVMDLGFSDHSPLCVEFQDQRGRAPKLFKFLNCLAKHKEFIPLVERAWNCNTQRRGMQDVQVRVKNVKQKIKKLNTKEFRNVAEKIKSTRTLLAKLQVVMRTDHQVAKFTHEKALRDELEKWSLVKESIFKPKSRVYWLKLGDANNSFFFANYSDCCRATSSIDPTTIKEGTLLHRENKLRLNRPVTDKEIHDELLLMRVITTCSLSVLTQEKFGNIRSEVYQMCLAGAVYHIWIERNVTVFTQGQKEEGIMVRHIIQEIHVRGFVKSKIAKKLDTMNFYP
ncbi:hypothetical protein RDI58_001477 [Solanum bulbocastanum]|uniref:Uncharacterized protein n=1 Tax=Solanum bulbocastanum TaxID=147425 RepID=A0AAN8U839_SOLBU